MEAKVPPRRGTLSAKLLDKDGNLIRDYGVVSEVEPVEKAEDNAQQEEPGGKADDST